MLRTRHRRTVDDVAIVDGDSELAAECEAFLTGTFVDLLHDRCDRAPVWTWLNDAAHGSRERLCALAASDVAGDVEVVTRTTISRAVLCACDDRDLVELQRTDLIPLELAIAGTELTPRRLVELVGRALYL